MFDNKHVEGCTLPLTRERTFVCSRVNASSGEY